MPCKLIDMIEHGGKRQDGQTDERTTQDFAHGKLDPHEVGKKGGSVGGGQELHEAQQNEIGDSYKPSENDGLTKSGEPDKRMKGNN